jgi:GDPmannose 4,6-dehydratase
MVRRTHSHNYDNIAHILDQLHLVDGDLLDQSSLISAIEQSCPDEIYNLAAQSHVGLSFTQPHATAQVTGIGVQRLLEAIRITSGFYTNVRLYQASTSELYGNSGVSPQNADTPFNPVSPYGTAKLFAHQTVKNYREGHGLWACSGILFNHESPRRGEDFVTRKISLAVARIKMGLQKSIELGNLAAQRDWGYAPDYVQAMWLMLQQAEPRDYVIATGRTHSVGEFLYRAIAHADIELSDDLIVQSGKHNRPHDVGALCGDASRARAELGWAPTVCFEDLVRIMVEEDVCRLKQASHVR